jgi:hypothetical protein
MREIPSVFIQTQIRHHEELTTIKCMVFRSCSMPYNRQGTSRGEMIGQFRFLKDLEYTVLFLKVLIRVLLLEVIRGVV